MITATMIGKYFQTKNMELSEIQVQKLTYYAYVWYMVINKGKKLFEERPQAWIHGPVFKSLFISMRYDRRRFDDGKVELDRDTMNFLDIIYKIYGKYSGNELENLTHSELPWQIARQGKPYYEYSEEYIKDEDIMQFYSQL